MGPAVNIMKKLCYAFSIQNKSTVVDRVEEVCAMRDAVFAFGADRTCVSSEQVPFPVGGGGGRRTPFTCVRASQRACSLVPV